MRIAVVEDNEVLADGIATAFQQEGHGVDQLHRGRPAIDFILQENLDLVILDFNLPDVSGIDVLRAIRAEGRHMPVLMLTARADIQDKISGLDAGADDYLTKPFNLEELKARVRALLRRRSVSRSNVLQLGPLEFDATAKSVRLAGSPLELPLKEFALLELLLSRTGQVVSKTDIMDHLYGAGSEVEESAAELYIHRLRKRLKACGVEIRTFRGLGYCLQESR